MLTLFLLLGLGCGPSDELRQDPEPDPTCEGFFGAPNENTGLDESVCRSEIGDWTPPVWTDDRLDALEAWTLLDPPSPLTTSPYGGTSDEGIGEFTVCGLLDQGEANYSLQTFGNAEDAIEAGAEVTHAGVCGMCSSLEDLAVYASIPDLTGPVRECGLESFDDGIDGVIDCLEDLGFSAPCASIWAYNVEHTREQCFDICISQLNEPYNTEDGALNDCLQCDEDQSGQVFKAVAGRTRRGSGLATAICRPCETVWRLDHRYSDPD